MGQKRHKWGKFRSNGAELGDKIGAEFRYEQLTCKNCSRKASDKFLIISSLQAAMVTIPLSSLCVYISLTVWGH